MNQELKFEGEIEVFLLTLARVFASRGASAEVAVLSMGKPSCEETGYDNWDGGIYTYTVTLEIPQSLFNQVADKVEVIEKSLLEGTGPLMRRYQRTCFGGFVIVPEMRSDPEWRDKAKKWLSGEGVTNQGRVRSDNVAPYMADGLLFRSRPEINLYRALKSHHLSFAPLLVFIRGGENYRRIEPDFVIFHGGKMFVIELDGQAFHHETPADAHARLTMLQYEGAHVERINAAECDTPDKASNCVKQIVSLLRKIIDNK